MPFHLARIDRLAVAGEDHLHSAMLAELDQGQPLARGWIEDFHAVPAQIGDPELLAVGREGHLFGSRPGLETDDALIEQARGIEPRGDRSRFGENDRAGDRIVAGEG